MRTYGRITVSGVTDSYGQPVLDDSGQQVGAGRVWVEVTTDENGNNDAVWLTTLIQTLLLNLGESPFYSQYGIPAQQSVMQQVFPDYYIALTQQAFSPYFASLLITKVSGTANPTYQVNVTTHQGVKINASVSIPQ